MPDHRSGTDQWGHGLQHHQVLGIDISIAWLLRQPPTTLRDSPFSYPWTVESIFRPTVNEVLKKRRKIAESWVASTKDDT